MRRGSVFSFCQGLSMLIFTVFILYRQSSLHREISLYDWRESSGSQLNHLDPDERIRHAVNVVRV